MQKWGPTMHQSYEQYDGQNELKVSTGITYPDGLSKELVEGQSGLIGWAPSGKGDLNMKKLAGRPSNFLGKKSKRKDPFENSFNFRMDLLNLGTYVTIFPIHHFAIIGLPLTTVLSKHCAVGNESINTTWQYQVHHGKSTVGVF